MKSLMKSVAAMFLHFRRCAYCECLEPPPLKCLGEPGDNGRHPWHRKTILVLGPRVWEFSAGKQGIDSQKAVTLAS
ncbi:hypothetical protein BGY98DRAFT_991741 [Russula aff. rugulosa BPL654]|nr:hypothetical protein BGY98DRAFT_991741 [Russula aff. rugulosa BPL654]